MGKTISQREARRLRRRVEELEARERQRRHAWSRDYPGGVNFWTVTIGESTQAAVQTARRLNHAVVAVPDGDKLRLYALGAE